MLKLLIILSLFLVTPEDMPYFTSETVPTEVGTYPVKVEYTDGIKTKSKIIQFTVISVDTVVEEYLAINAHDFTIGENAELTEEIILQMSEVKAWNLNTAEQYEIERLEVMRIDDTLYQVTFYSFQELTKTINIYVESDYNGNIILTEDHKNPTDGFNYIFSKYNLESISIILLILLLIVALYLIIRRYNKLLDNLEVGLENAKKINKK